jgi:N-acetyl-anhydromuramyl-L-alanine amidase AmpD
MPRYTKEQAAAFFEQLTTFSTRVFTSLKLPPGGSPFGASKWSGTKPTAAVIHWTGDDTLTSSIAWFADPAAQVSAHCVVSDRPLLFLEPFCQDLPLVKALPASVIQCRPVTSTAWHSCYMNGTAYGIENVNVGRLNTQNGTLCWDDCGKSKPYRSDKSAMSVFGQAYEPFTQAQVDTNVALLQYVDAYFAGGALHPSCILGHENVEGLKTLGASENKTDPGPCFPLQATRDAFVAGDASVAAVSLHPDYAQSYRVAIAERALNAATGVKWGSDRKDSVVWAVFMAKMAQASAVVASKQLRDAGLACLGYNAGGISDADLKLSVCAFQRLMGLTVDGNFGAKSAAALSGRLIDRFGGT